MLTTAQPAARILAQLLVGHGVTNAVISPGSRNTPLIIAVSRQPEITSYVVVDERSAGFVALGLAIQSGEPVALICTSGTALLNYAPAVAEAYYRCVPLIVVSADRPACWIDQDDSQTIRQFEALANIVNTSVDISSDYCAKDFVWYTNRQINDALLAAVNRRPGPVHINIHFDVPLGELTEVRNDNNESRIIHTFEAKPTIDTGKMRKLVREYLSPPRKVLIIAGFLPPDDRLTRTFNKLDGIPNVAVFYEAQSNLHHVRGGFGMIDHLLSSCSEETLDLMSPDVVITIGGSLVSRMVKNWLRDNPRVIHWHVGYGPRDRSIDIFQNLNLRFETEPLTFMRALSSALQPYKVNLSHDTYRGQWNKIYGSVMAQSGCYKWSDLQAIRLLVKNLSSRTNLHISNGTAIRYIQLCDYAHIHRIECNRGVSGIDGSTSTAIGAAMAYSGPTVLLTGDMSARYDIGAFFLGDIPSRLAVVILNNGGGDIFRVISSTRQLEEREQYFSCQNINTDFCEVAKATGFDYISVFNHEELDCAVRRINESRERPLIVEINTCESENANILREYLGENNRLKL